MMKKVWFLTAMVVAMLVLLAGCGCSHLWRGPTCDTPKTCEFCGETREAPLGHEWTEATCAAPKTCRVCGATEGDTPAHSWQLDAEVDGTCTAEGVQTYSCSVCGAVKTEETAKSSHQWVAATCTSPKTCLACRATEGAPLAHTFGAATCTAARQCTVCGTADGAALGHEWAAATCMAPKTCARCGETSGSLAAHSYADGRCKTCQLTDPDEICQTGEVWNVPGQWEFSFDSAIILKNLGNKQQLSLSWNYTNNGYSGDLKIGVFNFTVYDGGNAVADWSYDGAFSNSMGAYCQVGQSASCSVGSIIYNESKSLTVVVRITDSNGVAREQRFAVNVITADQLPPKENLNGCTINYSPVLPTEIATYADGVCQTKCTLSSVSFEVSGDDLYIYFTGKKTYDVASSGACKIGYRVYDRKNKIVASGSVYLPSLYTGQSFTKVRHTAENCIRAGESYRVEFYDVK